MSTFSAAAVPRRGISILDARHDASRTVVWLLGEHDVATATELSGTLARASGRDAADLTVDLAGVEFMGAATIGTLIEARELLRVQQRSLALRSPSRAARLVLGACDLNHIVEPAGAGACARRDPRGADATP